MSDRKNIIAALALGLSIGFVAGASFWHLYGYPPGTVEVNVTEPPRPKIST